MSMVIPEGGYEREKIADELQFAATRLLPFGGGELGHVLKALNLYRQGGRFDSHKIVSAVTDAYNERLCDRRDK